MLQIGHPCGLCNRLDVIATGYLMAKMSGENEIEVLWPLNDRHMPVSFHDLFTGLPLGRVVQQEIAPEVASAYLARQATLPADYRAAKFFGEMLGLVLANAVPEVRSEVEAFRGRHFHNSDAGLTVGIHVRRSESPMPLCPYAQPLRFYEAVIKSFPEDTRFFISTDSQEAFRWLQTRFHDRVFQRPKQHDDRNSIAGVREGLIDMLLLSRCAAIVGTYGSSFSGIAALAGGRPLLMMKAFPEVTADWPRFNRWRWLWAYRHLVRESTIWRRSYDWIVRPQAARIPRIPARCIRIARTYVRARLSAGHTPS